MVACTTRYRSPVLGSVRKTRSTFCVRATPIRFCRWTRSYRNGLRETQRVLYRGRPHESVPQQTLARREGVLRQGVQIAVALTVVPNWSSSLSWPWTRKFGLAS